MIKNLRQNLGHWIEEGLYKGNKVEEADLNLKKNINLRAVAEGEPAEPSFINQFVVKEAKKVETKMKILERRGGAQEGLREDTLKLVKKRW